MKKMSMTAIVVITLIISTIVLIFRFSNRNIKFGGSQAAIAALQKIKEGAFVLDVRTESEYQSGHFPGAKNIPVNMVATRLKEIPSNKPVVVYCAAGGRSASARDILIRSGYQDVINAGGIGDLNRAKNNSNQ
ncbi:MAG: rhodanese-like domain-containing protein [Leptospira sp.]|nr:rhodanese-like domain-containing protein [Leptospira sp.]